MYRSYNTGFGQEKCLINGKLYYINNSRTKFVNVGLSFDFDPCIEFGNNCSGGTSIQLNEDDWNCLLQHQGTITSYFFSSGYFDIPIRFNNITIFFDKIDDYNVVKIKNDDGRYIYLGGESACKLWDLIPVIEYRLDMLKGADFHKYFNGIKKSVIMQQGDLLGNVMNVILPKQNLYNENVSTILELYTIYPNILEYKLNYRRRRYHEEDGNV